jgi:Holliday junction resolvase RusA-like endonuclease
MGAFLNDPPIADDQFSSHKTILLVPGEPSTVTAQHKGISFRRKQVFTLAMIKAEGKRIKRDLLINQGGVFTRPKYPVTPYDGPLHCQIQIIYPLTLLQAQHHTDKLSDRGFTLHHWVRPDVDNTAKLILDTLTQLGFWHDDAQVDDLRLIKRYGSDPRITIWIVPEDP